MVPGRVDGVAMHLLSPGRCTLGAVDNKPPNTMSANTYLQLRSTTIADLEYLFEFQTDPEAIYLAAFTPKDPMDKAAYIADKILSHQSIELSR